MLTKFLFVLALIWFPLQSQAQFLDRHDVQATVSNTSETSESASVSSTQEEVPSQQNATAETDSSVDEDESVVYDYVPSVSVEEIIALESESKLSIRNALKNKDDSEKEALVDILLWQEKVEKIKELMLEGKSYEEAKKIADETIKAPQINVKDNEDVEKYIYEKGKFISDEK